MKTVEEYAVDLVCDGAESHAEDDIDEDGELTALEHEVAVDLAMRIIRALRAHPEALVRWAGGVDLPG